MAEIVEDDCEAESGLTVLAFLAFSGEPLTSVTLRPSDTVACLRKAIAVGANETGSLWLLHQDRLLLDHETLAEACLADQGRVGVVRCEPIPAVALPPTAPQHLRIFARCALSGDALLSVQMWPLDMLSALREVLRRRLIASGPLQLLLAGQLLVGPMTLVEAGLVDGAVVDVVRCEPRSVLTASADRTVRLWCAESAQHRLTLQHSEWVNWVHASPDGRRAVSSLFDGTAKVWDLQGGFCESMLVGHQGPVLAAVFSGDGRSILTGSYDRSAKLWNWETAECGLTLTGHGDGVTAVALSPLSLGRAATGSADRSARLWDLATGDCQWVLAGHAGEVLSVAFSPDGACLATASADHSIKLWHTETGTHVHTLPGHAGSVSSVAFSPHGLMLASGAADRTVRVWRVAEGDCVQQLSGHDDVVTSVSFSCDGQLVASSSVDGTVRLCNVETGEHLLSLTGHGDAVMSVCFAPGGLERASAL